MTSRNENIAIMSAVIAILITSSILYISNYLSDKDIQETHTIFKQVVYYDKEGDDPMLLVGDYNRTSFIVAFDDLRYNILLSDGKTVNIVSDPIRYDYGNNNQTTVYYGNVHSIIGKKVIIDYKIYKPTCVYVLDWGNDFHSSYHLENFSFTLIPNSTNYDFQERHENGRSCDTNVEELSKIQVVMK